MKAVLKIKVEELTEDWLAQLKTNYADAVLEVRVHELPNAAEDEDFFWEIINLLDWDSDKELSIIAPAVDALSRCAMTKIYAFQEHLSQKLYLLDTQNHARHIGTASYREHTYFPVDHFLYARACVVAHGKTVFQEVLNDPAQMPDNCTFESILRIASDAYEQKTGMQFRYVSSVGYETYSNASAWKMD